MLGEDEPAKLEKALETMESRLSIRQRREIEHMKDGVINAEHQFPETNNWRDIAFSFLKLRQHFLNAAPGSAFSPGRASRTFETTRRESQSSYNNSLRQSSTFTNSYNGCLTPMQLFAVGSNGEEQIDVSLIQDLSNASSTPTHSSLESLMNVRQGIHSRRLLIPTIDEGEETNSSGFGMDEIATPLISTRSLLTEALATTPRPQYSPHKSPP
ncbi:hypothetical protein J8273_3049 [Carpediemonas membranifera]|uniref:Uncharacterized protein n=1 Tax=Carpediemonas membranifera TaxID=201153 RepID=A0A8J6AZZ0_9EUKA|nr:hypothetical protein J8273_3049 [Carpediemonas membranifera]|eukprot:KAG9395475.1 hypothetical protein J8273_3049 [Carpediemonas membranifera]